MFYFKFQVQLKIWLFVKRLKVEKRKIDKEIIFQYLDEIQEECGLKKKAGTILSTIRLLQCVDVKSQSA